MLRIMYQKLSERSKLTSKKTIVMVSLMGEFSSPNCPAEAGVGGKVVFIALLQPFVYCTSCISMCACSFKDQM